MLLQGLTPLHIAVKHRHPDLVEILLSNGANVTATNRQASQFLSNAVAYKLRNLDDIPAIDGQRVKAQQNLSIWYDKQLLCWLHPVNCTANA